jgi:hypothetical protein
MKKSWCILWLFGIFYGHLVTLVAVLYIFPRFGILKMKNVATLPCTGFVHTQFKPGANPTTTTPALW